MVAGTVIPRGGRLPSKCEQIPHQSLGGPVYWRPIWVVALGVPMALFLSMSVAWKVQAAMDMSIPRVSLAAATPAAYLLIAYTVGIIAARMSERGTDPLYELLWACNTSMLLAAVGILTDTPVAISGAILAVSLDQLCWYVDVAGYLVKGRWGWPVGVSGYLNDPDQQTLVRYLTSWHHLWFIPLGMWLLSGGVGGFTWHALPIACTVTGSLLLYCRATTQLWFALQQPDGSHVIIYKNLNLSHGFWRDVKLPIMHRFNDAPPYILLPWIFLTGNLGLHTPPFLLLLGISWMLG